MPFMIDEGITKAHIPAWQIKETLTHISMIDEGNYKYIIYNIIYLKTASINNFLHLSNKNEYYLVSL